MKMKKLLASIFAAAMVLGAMSFSVLATEDDAPATAAFPGPYEIVHTINGEKTLINGSIYGLNQTLSSMHSLIKSGDASYEEVSCSNPDLVELKLTDETNQKYHPGNCEIIVDEPFTETVTITYKVTGADGETNSEKIEITCRAIVADNDGKIGATSEAVAAAWDTFSNLNGQQFFIGDFRGVKDIYRIGFDAWDSEGNPVVVSGLAGVYTNSGWKGINGYSATPSKVTTSHIETLFAGGYFNPSSDVLNIGFALTSEIEEDITVMITVYNNMVSAPNFPRGNSHALAARSFTFIPDAVAKAGNNYYPSIQAAIDAAEDGDTIVIKAGTYDAFTVPADKNNLTFVGETDADGNNLVTIRTLEDDIDTQTKGIYVQAEKATFKNLNIVSGSALVKWLCSAIGATNNSVGLGHSNLNDLTIENCNFKGNGSEYAVWTRACDVTIKDSTIEGYTYAVESYNLGADQEINIIGTEITDTGSAIHTANTAVGSLIAVKDSVISADIMNPSGEGDMTIDGSVLNNVNITAYQKLTITITDSALYDSKVATNHDTAKVNLSAVYANNVNELAEAAKAENITFSTYYPTYEEFKAGTGLKEVPAVTDAIYVKFEKADVEDGKDSDEEADLYNINLVATDGEIINRLNSADLTFALTTEDAIAYEIIDIANDNITFNAVDNSENRYEFHFTTKTDVTNDTATSITIAQVKFTGYGTFSFAVDTTANDTNAVHATTIADNIVDTFIPNGDTESVADGELVINDTTITDILIAVPTRDLVINIDFPNAVKADNNYKYQDMKVTVSGGDLDKAIVVDLGADAVMPEITTDVKTEAKVEVTTSDKYVITLTDVLKVNTAYNVEVSGAGYRTAKYTVTMNCDESKTLNFWNNVKDNAFEVEEGKASSAKNVTFLAGDIVKDGNINIYDLSAVVSYFGEIDLDEDNKPEYAKYDLNRDGKIDSKDVAYVLVSWGK